MKQQAAAISGFGGTCPRISSSHLKCLFRDTKLQWDHAPLFFFAYILLKIMNVRKEERLETNTLTA
jgi:hypothetical protein